MMELPRTDLTDAGELQAMTVMGGVAGNGSVGRMIGVLVVIGGVAIAGDGMETTSCSSKSIEHDLKGGSDMESCSSNKLTGSSITVSSVVSSSSKS